MTKMKNGQKSRIGEQKRQGKMSQHQGKNKEKDKDQEKDIQKFSDYTPFICLASISRSDQRFTKAQQLTLHPGLCASFCVCLHILMAFSLSIPKIVVCTQFMKSKISPGEDTGGSGKGVYVTGPMPAPPSPTSAESLKLWFGPFSFLIHSKVCFIIQN